MHIKWFLVILFFQIDNTVSFGGSEGQQKEYRRDAGESVLLPLTHVTIHPAACSFTLIGILTGQVDKVRESGSGVYPATNRQNDTR